MDTDDSNIDICADNQEPACNGPVLFYTDEVSGHFTHPRNVGELPENKRHRSCLGVRALRAASSAIPSETRCRAVQ